MIPVFWKFVYSSMNGFPMFPSKKLMFGFGNLYSPTFFHDLGDDILLELAIQDILKLQDQPTPGSRIITPREGAELMKMDQRVNCEALVNVEFVEGHVGKSTNGFNAQQKHN